VTRTKKYSILQSWRLTQHNTVNLNVRFTYYINIRYFSHISAHFIFPKICTYLHTVLRLCMRGTTITTHEHKQPSLDHIWQSLGQRRWLQVDGNTIEHKTANWHRAHHISQLIETTSPQAVSSAGSTVLSARWPINPVNKPNPVIQFTAAFQDPTKCSILWWLLFLFNSSRTRAPLNWTLCYGA